MITGLGGVSLLRQLTVGGRGATYISRENTWSNEHDGHVCLSTLWEDANDTEYRGLQIT